MSASGAAGRRGVTRSVPTDDHPAGDDNPEDTDDAPLSPETFEDYWSEELAVAYHAVLDGCARTGMTIRATMNDFCEFAYKTSSGRPPNTD